MQIPRMTTSFGVLASLVGPQSYGAFTSLTQSGVVSMIGDVDRCEQLGTKPPPLTISTNSSPNEFSIFIKGFESSCGVIEFEDSVEVRGQSIGNEFELAMPEAGILEFGYSYEECLQNFSDALAFRWDEYAMESDENLSPKALVIAKYLRALAKG